MSPISAGTNPNFPSPCRRVVREAPTAFTVGMPIAIGAPFAAAVMVIADGRVATGAIFALVMMSIAVFDAWSCTIPDQLTLAAIALGCLYAVTVVPGETMLTGLEAVLRGSAVAICFWIMRAAYRRFRGREGLGFGDVKLAAVAGIWLDWSTVPLAIEIATLTALTFHVATVVLRRKAISPTAKLPFGLFFAPAIWLAWVVQCVTE